MKGRILYIQYTDPAAYPPLEHSSRLLAESGWEVRFLGKEAYGEARALRFVGHRQIDVRLMPYAAPGLRQKINYICYALWCAYHAFIWGPDWVYASDPLSAPVALFISTVVGRRIVYHEHDAPTDRAQTLFMRACLRARRAMARIAEFCVFPNAERAEVFRASAGRPRAAEIVWDCPAVEEVASTSNAHDGLGLKVCYQGSITPERLGRVVEAIALLPSDVVLTIVGYETVGTKGYTAELLRTAGTLGLDTSRVRVQGAVPTRRDLFQAISGQDIGLSLMPVDRGDINMRTMLGASNKSFDFLACGIPILVSDLPDWRTCFVDGGYGLACDPREPRSIAAAIQTFYDNREMLRLMGERGRQRVMSDWNYDGQFARVYSRLARALLSTSEDGSAMRVTSC